MKRVMFPQIKIEGFKNSFRRQNYLKIIFVAFLFALISFGFFKLQEMINGYLNWQYSSSLLENLSAKMPIDYSFLKPFRNWKVKDLKIEALSAISVAVDHKGKEYVLFAKNPDKVLPIASLSKILSGFVVVENYDLNKVVKFSKKAIEAEEAIGFFKEGERFYVKDLLHSVMLESSNDATVALAEVIGEKRFVKMMQKQAEEIGLKNTHFVDPIGRDPDFKGEGYNKSTSRDLAKLAKFIIEKSKTDPRVDFLVKITQKKEFYLYTSDNSFHHKIKNTNELLENPHYKNEIIFGKTGYTPMAGECFLLIIKHKEGFIINVILNSRNRFRDMEKLIDWVKSAYIW